LCEAVAHVRHCLQSTTPGHEVKSDAADDIEKMPVDQVLAQLAVKPDQG
jgi:hypothetical protein